MQPNDQTLRLAKLLADARRSGVRLTAVPADLMPANGDEADLVQDAQAAFLGAVAAYKVTQIGRAPGVWGAIFSSGLSDRPERVLIPGAGIKVECEIAFVLAADLPGRPDGRDYQRDEVEAAIAGAVVAVEILQDRLPAEPPPAEPLVRANSLGNFGLVAGARFGDWHSVAVPKAYAVDMRVSERAVVTGHHLHPSGVDPLHPVVWLANALCRRAGGLRAGQVVTTGALGGAHPAGMGDRVQAMVEGQGAIDFVLAEQGDVPHHHAWSSGI